MRLQWLREGLSLVIALLLSAFCLFDEEPLFDATDWNALHCLFLLLAAMVVIWENITRARYGQFVYKDQVLLFATFSFWFFLENYIRAIVIIFFLHCLVPFEAELLELVEVNQAFLAWVSATQTPALLLLTATLLLGLLLNLSLAWARLHLLIYLATGVVLSLLVNLFLMGWDFIFAGLSGANWQKLTTTFYNQPKTSLTYDVFFNLTDQFDWHREKAYPFVMRFEDLYQFYFQLLNILTLWFCSLVWLSLLIDLCAVGQFGVSYTYVAVGLRWLEQTLYSLLCGHFTTLIISLRIALRTPFEFWGLLT